MIQFMFENPAEEWEESLKKGDIVPIFKKGQRKKKENYRGVCLLAMGSRIIARVLACRLRWWAERIGLLDENQAGFREGRSTADATQVMVRIQEDITDYKKRREQQQDKAEEREEIRVEARLLDLQKAYPRVNRPCLWGILERYGLKGKIMTTIKGLHETTSYKVKGRGEYSEEWTPVRGLREGCPTSPVLFNIYHQAVMRTAERNRLERGEQEAPPGIEWSYVPGSNFPSLNLWEKFNSEATKTRLTSSLFADDTTILGETEEMTEGVRIIKETMKEYEEKNNDNKEERLIFGDIVNEDIRMLGTWMGTKEDMKQRRARANRLWFLVKKRLKGTRLSKVTQARIVSACVESALLFDCHTRVWYIKEIKELQQWMDRAYRFIWSNKTGPPLRQMQNEHRNMYDVRKRLRVTSIRSKIEKRVLERVGHIMRMEEGRLVKQATLGWWSELEEWGKTKGRKRKTILYWKKLIREAGWDWCEIGSMTKDREGWRERVRERISHIQLYEDQQGHDNQDQERVTRDAVWEERREDGVEGFTCPVEGCGKVCRSRGGLTIHRRRMHEAARKIFKCQICSMEFEQEANLLNHQKICVGDEEVRPGVMRCARCEREVSKTNIARHRRTCREARVGVAGRQDEEGGAGGGVARVYVARTKDCPRCGSVLSATNMARHLRSCGGRPRE